MSTTGVRVETTQKATLVRLAHGRANAIDPVLVESMTSVAAELARGTGPVVLAGQGGFFSAGLDLVRLSGLDRGGIEAFMRGYGRMVEAWYGLSRPVVCAVNGHAIAGGCVLAQLGDLRIGERGPFRIGVNEVELGLPFPASMLRLFQERMGARDAYRVTATARLFDPGGALAAGLLDELADDAVAAALDVAEELGRLPAGAFATNKSYARAPVLREISEAEAAHLPGFVDLWYSEETRRRVGAVVARLSRSPT